MSMLTSRPSAGISKKHHCFFVDELSFMIELQFIIELLFIIQLSSTIELSSMKNEYANLPAFGQDFKKSSLIFWTSCPLILSFPSLLSCLSSFSCPLLLSRKERLFFLQREEKAFFPGQKTKVCSFCSNPSFQTKKNSPFEKKESFSSFLPSKREGRPFNLKKHVV